MRLSWKCTFEQSFALTFCKKCAILCWKKSRSFLLVQKWKSFVKQGKCRFFIMPSVFVLGLTVSF